jgi:hypothetical protein
MGDPIDIGKIRSGDTIRVVNPVGETTLTVREITDMGTGLLMVWGGINAYGGRPGVGGYNTFFLVERPSHKNARMLTELKRGKLQIPEDILNYKLAPLLGLKKTGKGRRKTRRRKTRRTRSRA